LFDLSTCYARGPCVCDARLLQHQSTRPLALCIRLGAAGLPCAFVLKRVWFTSGRGLDLRSGARMTPAQARSRPRAWICIRICKLMRVWIPIWICVGMRFRVRPRVCV
jgi:hypothetical protein